jgi:ethanolamine utilization protein EutQ (cupin superfamily)
MKIIVEGEMIISDETGASVHAKPGDIFYFRKGSKIRFDTPSYGIGFFCGQRQPGEA